MEDFKQKANHAEVTQAAAIKRNSALLSLAKKLLPRNCYPSGWHCCPNPNCNPNCNVMQAKKRLLCVFPIPFLSSASILRILPFHAFVPQARIKPGCNGWKTIALITRLRSSQQCIIKIPYLNQMPEKKAIEGYA